ncbi:MAG: dTDP-4-dehydrorhamnose 3,5-epimerase family protein, partial [Magnetococcales bacterium]|nr:dTDP-4-dehydrorhamnose 3,5-epimerase family protein [Magnetococcales bacterium]
FLVAVDIRYGSPTQGHWFGLEAAASDHLHLYAPAGFARGFAVLSDEAEIQYLCTSIYNPAGESGFRWDDPDIGIQWPLSPAEVSLSNKDQQAQSWQQWLARPESQQFVY